MAPADSTNRKTDEGPLVRPFAGLRPAPGRAAEVAAPPYDVLTSEEARARAKGKEWSFLHVSKAEIDLPPGTDPHADEVYAKAGENLRRMISEGVLVRDKAPGYSIYRLTRDGKAQTGVALAASLAAYASNRVRRHELTRPDKEQDRVRQIEAVGAQTGPVMVVHRAQDALAALIEEAAQGEAACDVSAEDGVRHQLWTVTDAPLITRLSEAFCGLDALYIADGHHRSAAAARVAAARGETDGVFLVVSFPDDEVIILDYNRVVRDLNGLSPEDFIDRLGENFAVTPSDNPARPARPGEFGMYLAGRWYRLELRQPPAPDAVPTARLDIALLTDRLLAPVLAIGDPRTDPRIDFVGGGRGLDGLARRVESGEMAVAFALFPTRMADLIAVADAGEIMPPKSTWFEPKLADGLISYPLD